jgi:hypothetical protein
MINQSAVTTLGPAGSRQGYRDAPPVSGLRGRVAGRMDDADKEAGPTGTLDMSDYPLE